ncbi:hypothetical protein ILUMI_12280 [Ignelater luminosus]|uniref:PiggyBac transposable element-derived protein domain-containing protein n=1 Tax=Ignelater luminosus TaxID=2038154 RepID=A0A8K0GCG4_IGNLU|nr:hypothetical protein ILUMI_12280 [Ignelater luminosus]
MTSFSAVVLPVRLWEAIVDEEVSDVEDVFVDPNIRIELDSDDEEDIHDTYADEESASDEQDQHNIFRQRPGPVKSTETLSTHDVFKCIFSDVMCTIIIKETNRKAKSVYDKWNAERPEKKTCRELTPEEFNRYLGILVTAGVRHSSSERERELWRCDAYPLYRPILPITRFCEISRFIRFDNEYVDSITLHQNVLSLMNSFFHFEEAENSPNTCLLNQRSMGSKFGGFVTLTTLTHLRVKYILESHYQGEKSTRANESCGI